MRYKYFDIAKGILMIVVIIHHLPAVATKCNLSNSVFECVDYLDFMYRCSFMPAFFIITGCCSNFDKELRPFLLSNVKGLIVPAFAMSVICQLFEIIYPPHEFQLNVLSLLYCGGAFWFLPALFISKTIFWIVNKVKDAVLKTCLVFAISLLSSVLCSISFVYNPWYVIQAMLLLPFLYIGSLVKYKKTNGRNCLLLGGAYFLMVALLKLQDYIFPSVTMVLTLDITNFFNYIFVASTGGLFVVSISQFIEHCRFLEFFGRSTVIVYTLHIEVLIFLFYVLREVSIPFGNILFDSFVFLLLLMATIVLTSLFSLAFRSKWLKIFIGQF